MLEDISAEGNRVRAQNIKTKGRASKEVLEVEENVKIGGIVFLYSTKSGGSTTVYTVNFLLCH